MYRNYNPNPRAARVGDCTVRAISKAMDMDWDTAYINLIIHGFTMCDMPSANAVWGAYLKSHGYTRHLIPDSCPDCYTVEAFCADHPRGKYVLALSGHVVAVEDGDWFDTWDSGEEVPIYYWERSNTDE